MKIKPLLLTLALTISLFSCKNEDIGLESFAIDRERLTPTTNGVVINGSYSFAGTIEGMIVNIGEEESLVDAITYELQLQGLNFSANIEDLKPSTTYYYSYSVDYGNTLKNIGSTRSFTTLDVAAESPLARTIDFLAIDSTTFRIKCEVVSDGGLEVTERGICYNTYGDPTMDDDTLQHASGGLGQYTVRIEDMSPATRYYVRAFAKNARGIGFGDVLEFRTGGATSLPQVSTVEVSNVTYNTAQCLGNVSGDGGLAITERGVCWGLEPDPTVNVHHAIAEGTDLGNYTVPLDGLQPNTTYRVRCYAVNEKGTAYGEELTFTTTEGKPTVTTSAVTDITSTSATGGGTVTDEGASIVTERGLCWSLNHEPTLNDSHASNSTGTGTFTVSMTGLTPNKTYYARAYATNGQGTSYGAEVSFTAKEGLPVVQTIEVTDITATTAKAHATVTDEGGSTVTERGVCWSTDHSPTINGSHANSGTGAGEYTVNLTNLTPGTKYYVRAYAKNTQGLTYGEQIDFTTQAILPTIIIEGIEGTTVHYTVATTGGAAVTESGVCWGTSHNPTTNNSHASSGTGTGSFSVELTDLAPGTTYYLRAYASNSIGTAYSMEQTLTTVAKLPTVITGEVSNVTQTTAQGSGNVTNDGGADVTERGICWGTSHNPTTSDSHANNGTGTGNFTVNMTGLTANTTYYMRAYATNNAGTAYGTEVSFTTLSNGGNTPQGAINGLFTIRANGDQVYFSQGNLQYHVSTNTWRFAENQWEYVGEANSNISQNYNGWIDLFGWGTSGWNPNNSYYRPWDSNNSDGSLYGPPGQYNLTGSYANSDWGYYNAISNGGNTAHQWSTLTHEEWEYVFNTRSTSSGIRYAKTQVNGVNGVILLPDDWSTSYYSLNSTNQGNVSYTSNVINSSQWNTLEQHGAVFLPAAGNRDGHSVGYVGSIGHYWSASYYGSYGAYYVYFDVDYLRTYGAFYRYDGYSVRLVCPAE